VVRGRSGSRGPAAVAIQRQAARSVSWGSTRGSPRRPSRPFVGSCRTNELY
jgi:hypothetical protein